MGSFKSIISSIWHGIIKVEPTVEAASKVLLPATAPLWAMVDPIIGKLQNSIVTIEANAPIDTAGNVKFNAVFTDFKAGLDVMNAVLAAEGKEVVFDEASFTAGTNAQVEALRQFAVLRASIRIVQIPKAA